MAQAPSVEGFWRSVLADEHSEWRRRRRLYRLIPSERRCKMCNAPFDAPWWFFMYLWGRGPRGDFCTSCMRLLETHPDGAEIELTVLFADAQRLAGYSGQAWMALPAEFHRLMVRFDKVARGVLLETEAIRDWRVNYDLMAIYVPGFAGSKHPSAAVRAGRELLRATGHGGPGQPWLPVGIGIHTGTAYFGADDSCSGEWDIGAAGDAVDTAAHLASTAGPGEIVVSEATCAAAGLDMSKLEQRRLEPRGRSEPVGVRVLRATLATPVGRGTS